MNGLSFASWVCIHFLKFLYSFLSENYTECFAIFGAEKYRYRWIDIFVIFLPSLFFQYRNDQLYINSVLRDTVMSSQSTNLDCSNVVSLWIFSCWWRSWRFRKWRARNKSKTKNMKSMNRYF